MKAAAKPVVLIVEDDAAIADNLREILELEGYEVATAANGVQALFALDGKLRPALIILDLMMPVMDGEAFRCEQLARAPEVAGIPVVGWSAFDHLRPDFEVIPKTGDGHARLMARIREAAPVPPRRPSYVSTRRLGIFAAIVASLVTLVKTLIDHWPKKPR